MATRSERPIPFRAIHPGEILREELKERGIKQKDFAQAIDVQPTHLNEFIKGKRNMNEKLAMKLERALGIPYSNWMNLHNSYVYNYQAIGAGQSEGTCITDYQKMVALHMASESLENKYGALDRLNLKEEANVNAIGTLLRDRRKALNLTQKELAERAGTAQSYIARIEKGDADIHLSNFCRIISAMGLRLELV